MSNVSYSLPPIKVVFTPPGSGTYSTGSVTLAYQPPHDFAMLNQRVFEGHEEPVKRQLAVILSSSPRPLDITNSISYALSRGKDELAELLLTSFTSHRTQGSSSSVNTTAFTEIVNEALRLSTGDISVKGVELLLSKGARITDTVVSSCDAHCNFDVVGFILRRFGFQPALVGRVYCFPGKPNASSLSGNTDARSFQRSVLFVSTLLSCPNPSTILANLESSQKKASEIAQNRSFMIFIINRLYDYQRGVAAPIPGSSATSSHSISERVVRDFIALKSLMGSNPDVFHKELIKPHKQES